MCNQMCCVSCCTCHCHVEDSLAQGCSCQDLGNGSEYEGQESLWKEPPAEIFIDGTHMPDLRGHWTTDDEGDPLFEIEDTELNEPFAKIINPMIAKTRVVIADGKPTFKELSVKRKYQEDWGFIEFKEDDEQK